MIDDMSLVSNLELASGELKAELKLLKKNVQSENNDLFSICKLF